jgi:hypothetical protein
MGMRAAHGLSFATAMRKPRTDTMGSCLPARSRTILRQHLAHGGGGAEQGEWRLPLLTFCSNRRTFGAGKYR